MTTTPGTVLVVEDEESIADVLAIALRYHRFEVMTAGTVREALALTEHTSPDCALLDVMLPDGDGRALGRELRGRRPQTALVFLTARDAPAEIVGALGFGDDYITKPFNIDEVVARVTAVLRRTRPADVLPQRAPLRHGDLELDETTYSARRAGRSVELTPPSTRCCASWCATPAGSCPRSNCCGTSGSTSTPRRSRPSWRPTSAICAASWTPSARR